MNELLSPIQQRRLAWALPIIALIIGLIRLVIPALHLRNAGIRHEELRQQVSRLREQQRALASRPLGELSVAVPPTEDREPIAFLSDLDRIARESRVVLVGIRPVPKSREETEPAKGKGKGAGKAPARPAVTGLEELAESVEIEGPFAYLVGFISRLETDRRVLAISDLRITSGDYPLLTATMQLTRFVTSLPRPQTGGSQTRGADSRG